MHSDIYHSILLHSLIEIEGKKHQIYFPKYKKKVHIKFTLHIPITKTTKPHLFHALLYLNLTLNQLWHPQEGKDFWPFFAEPVR